jgi:hypothetical protein
VPDGHYIFRISGRDAAGNGAVLAIPVTVDRTLSSIRWSKSSFYPQDGDAIARSSQVTFSLKRTAAVTVGIYSGTKLIKTVWTNRRMAAGTWGWTWDGRNAAGVLVAPGSYVARITAASSLGTSVLTRAVAADAFSVRLSATAVRAGQKLIVTLTTTEPLRAAPTVSFTQPGRAAVKRTATSLGSGRYRVTFSAGSGTAGIATVRIAGRDKAGGLNVTTRSVTIR